MASCASVPFLSEMGSRESQRAAVQSVPGRCPAPLCNPGSFNEMGALAGPVSAVPKSLRASVAPSAAVLLQGSCPRAASGRLAVVLLHQR